MKRIRDPEGVEAKHLLSAGQFTDKDVLEIGCGCGCLTWQFAGFANKVYGIDLGLSDLLEGKNSQPVSINNVYLAQTSGVTLPFPSGIFDVAVFSSSL